jgi:hypothetical protein
MVYGNFGKSWDGSICDEKHVSDALAVMGYTVIECQREMGIAEGEPDLVIVSQWNGYQKNFIEELKKKYNCPVVYWAFDYQWEAHEDWHFEMATQADLFLSPEMEHAHEYKEAKANFQWLPQGFAPMFLDRIDDPTIIKEHEIVFTGTYLPTGGFRTDVLKKVDSEYHLDVFSITQNEWKAQGLKNVHPPVLDYDLPDLVSKTKITLSVDLFPGRAGCWSDRNAQVMSCGGLVLYKYTPLSEEEFGDGVVYFNTIDECLSRIDFLLKNPDVAKEIAKTGYFIAKTRLSALARVKNLITIIENIL